MTDRLIYKRVKPGLVFIPYGLGCSKYDNCFQCPYDSCIYRGEWKDKYSHGFVTTAEHNVLISEAPAL